jgi:membrane-bound lytic murein transglycosylase F
MRFRPLPILLILLFTLSGCSPDMTLVDRIKDDGTLIVVTRNSATTYYEGTFGPTGLEYDLANLFAEHLGVKLKLVVEENYSRMFALLNEGKVDIAAAGLTITDSRKKQLQFGSPYTEVTQQVVYRIRSNSKRPRKIRDLFGKDIEVTANSSHAETLAKLQKNHPDLYWEENEELDSDELLQLVWSQFIDYTIANSTEIKLKQRLYPELATAFNISKPEPVAWAMRKDIDDSLYNETVKFFGEIKQNGTLKELINKYYGHVRKFNYVGTQAYLRDIAKKLPKYIDIFKLSAHAQHLDWRLLAAVGYQESHWNPEAVSPTGVRGIMMLTKDTAKFVGIQNRRDTTQSIEGGAKYLRYMIDKMPNHIHEPDRTWMALASYNVGYGHLEDARIITERRGNNPDKWVDVKESLPLLSKKKWYKTVKHGYARGKEPVGYVSNIRNYYELLLWHDELGSYQEEQPPPPISISSPSL